MSAVETIRYGEYLRTAAGTANGHPLVRTQTPALGTFYWVGERDPRVKGGYGVVGDATFETLHEARVYAHSLTPRHAAR